MIYDCFLFLNELELLEIRLNYLYDIVDKFVLVEMGKTFSNHDKPFYFEENKKLFTKFLDKIIHIKVTHYPENDNNPLKCWVFENYQRDCIMRGLTEAKPDDIIMVSDVDEIPSISAIKSYNNGIYSFKQVMSYYYLNYVCENEPIWRKAKICRYSDLINPKESPLHISNSNPNVTLLIPCMTNAERGMPSYIRNVICDEIENGGWHFSSIGGAERIAYKTESFSHQEWNKKEFVNIKNIESHMKNGTDVYGRHLIYKPVPLDNSYPEYILKNREKYKDLIKDCKPTNLAGTM